MKPATHTAAHDDPAGGPTPEPAFDAASVFHSEYAAGRGGGESQSAHTNSRRAQDALGALGHFRSESSTSTETAPWQAAVAELPRFIAWFIAGAAGTALIIGLGVLLVPLTH